MRVTAGIGKWRRLRAPSGAHVRPTSDKVKQALFNIIGEKIEGAVFLDLFSGAGGVGIEALSRNAGQAVFVDASRDSCNAVKQNLARTGFEGRAEVVLLKADIFLKKPSGPYDMVFLDPPYVEELLPLLEKIDSAGILKPESIVIAEHFKKQPSPETAGRLVLYREARYGDTVLAFYRSS